MVSYYAGRANEYERIYAKPERQEDLRRLRGLLDASGEPTDSSWGDGTRWC
jgi:hypothetical protein